MALLNKSLPEEHLRREDRKGFGTHVFTAGAADLCLERRREQRFVKGAFKKHISRADSKVSKAVLRIIISGQVEADKIRLHRDPEMGSDPLIVLNEHLGGKCRVLLILGKLPVVSEHIELVVHGRIVYRQCRGEKPLADSAMGECRHRESEHHDQQAVVKQPTRRVTSDAARASLQHLFICFRFPSLSPWRSWSILLTEDKNFLSGWAAPAR